MPSWFHARLNKTRAKNARYGSEESKDDLLLSFFASCSSGGRISSQIPTELAVVHNSETISHDIQWCWDTNIPNPWPSQDSARICAMQIVIFVVGMRVELRVHNNCIVGPPRNVRHLLTTPSWYRYCWFYSCSFHLFCNFQRDRNYNIRCLVSRRGISFFTLALAVHITKPKLHEVFWIAYSTSKNRSQGYIV